MEAIMALSKNTPALSRRTALKGIAAVSTTALAGGVAMAAEKVASPDADLMALFSRMKAATEEQHRLQELFERDDDAYYLDLPPMPQVLKVTPSDLRLTLPLPRDRRSPGYFTVPSIMDLENFHPVKLTETPLKEHLAYLSYPGYRPSCNIIEGMVRYNVVWSEAAHRRDELLKVLRNRREIEHEIAVKHGVHEDKPEIMALQDEVHDLLKAITAAEALTLDGIVVKAEALKLYYNDLPEIDLGEAPDCQLAVSVVESLIKMQGSAVIPNIG
jgi:hypothetical protein